jgi:hypothetical protein
MDFLLYFGLFRTYIHGNQRFGSLYHEICSGIPVAGVSTYRSRILPSVKSPCVYEEGHTWVLHIACTNLHHTYTHMLGTHASFLGIPTLRWSLSSETLHRGAQIYPYSFLRTRPHQWTFSLFWFV